MRRKKIHIHQQRYKKKSSRPWLDLLLYFLFIFTLPSKHLIQVCEFTKANYFGFSTNQYRNIEMTYKGKFHILNLRGNCLIVAENLRFVKISSGESKKFNKQIKPT